ncbi:aminotransferase class V-fold PLP-dependent enzyme [Corynebacterium hesseae]|uniref:aminotransferase class V-fold PLP-dependent enzyme n=1 Tax=Corynebacterium hesseae TaxID=2913502 RepID=UPI00373F08BB
MSHARRLVTAAVTAVAAVALSVSTLDASGIEASAGSACHAGVNRMSHVLEAMGIDEEHGRGSLRFSLGRLTTEEDIDAVLAELPEIIRRARSV